MRIPLHRAIIGTMMMFRVVQDVDLNYQHSARLIVHVVRSLSAKYRPDRYRRDKSVKFGTELP